MKKKDTSILKISLKSKHVNSSHEILGPLTTLQMIKGSCEGVPVS